eukprot:CAMPEP_0171462592 /NCGR_PEP_ID=MMETSP0945-20130129/6567_1 /TAXON_ID=109269 /ORGANISM="Vaucheria litorea, Strain CCMP2940" /LENGTH=351 /DNA_ID=CAMNT_0011989147 /DNA_START=178 /DNA_END=1233 /DNA_ORIENTATION=-
MKKRWKGPTKTIIDVNDDGTSYQEFSDLLAVQRISFSRGETVKGVVLQYDNRGLLIDIGTKSPAFLPQVEASLGPVDSIENLFKIGDTVDCVVIGEENETGQVSVSVRRLQYDQSWEKVDSLYETDEVFEAEIISVNDGGAVALVQGLRAFLPGSHICGGTPSEDLIGKSLSFKFLEVNKEINKLVVSNRLAVQEQEMAELSRGDIVEGFVKSIQSYGAFVEVRGMNGLLHISQISYDRVEDMGAVLKEGMKLKCMIIDYDKLSGRIALSTKTLEPEPGDMLKNPQKVYDLAEDTAAKYHVRMEAERKAREEAAKAIVMGLGDGFDTFDTDVLAGITDGLDSVLRSGEQSS